jgi:hypothetical protein
LVIIWGLLTKQFPARALTLGILLAWFMPEEIFMQINAWLIAIKNYTNYRDDMSARPATRELRMLNDSDAIWHDHNIQIRIRCINTVSVTLTQGYTPFTPMTKELSNSKHHLHSQKHTSYSLFSFLMCFLEYLMAHLSYHSLTKTTRMHSFHSQPHSPHKQTDNQNTIHWQTFQNLSFSERTKITKENMKLQSDSFIQSLDLLQRLSWQFHRIPLMRSNHYW